MKTYMPLDGFRWSCDSDSALCDMRQTNVLGRAGGGGQVRAEWGLCHNCLGQVFACAC